MDGDTTLLLVHALDVGTRERVVGEPPADAEAVGADRREQVPAVGRAGGFHDAGNRSHREPRVAAADLAAALDEHDTEAAVATQARLRERPVARLEHVEWQHRVGEQHGAEGEHRQGTPGHLCTLAARGRPENARGTGSVGARPQTRRRLLRALGALSGQLGRERVELGGRLAERAEAPEQPGLLAALPRREAGNLQP